MTTYITATPNPVDPGHRLSVCYTFPENGPDKVELSIRFKLEDGSFDERTVVLDREHSCWEPVISVPRDAVTCCIDDLTGDSDDLTVTISAD